MWRIRKRTLNAHSRELHRTLERMVLTHNHGMLTIPTRCGVGPRDAARMVIQQARDVLYAIRLDDSARKATP